MSNRLLTLSPVCVVVTVNAATLTVARALEWQTVADVQEPVTR